MARILSIDFGLKRTGLAVTDPLQIIKDMQKNFPDMPIKKVDERYTSKMAKDAMLEMGLKKMQRRNKALVDEIAATIMLQEYLRSIG